MLDCYGGKWHLKPEQCPECHWELCQCSSWELKMAGWYFNLNDYWYEDDVPIYHIEYM